jgi:tetratricopeptide (TPR) repeat protein
MRAALLALSLFLTGCAVQTAALREHPPAGLPPVVELAATPFFPQTDHQCGPAALATALGAAGIAADPTALADEVFVPARAGSLQTEILAGARRHGAVATRIPGELDALLRELAAGHPVVVLQNLGLSFVPLWHYAVVVGHDLPRGELLLRSGRTDRERLPLSTFEHTWGRSGFWGFVALPPGEWPATAHAEAAIEAAVGFERSAPPAVAARVYASALQRWPGTLSLQVGWGNSLRASGEPERAAEVFRAAAEQHRSAAAFINLSDALLALGRRDEAQQAARAALALHDRWQLQARQALDEASQEPLKTAR